MDQRTPTCISSANKQDQDWMKGMEGKTDRRSSLSLLNPTVELSSFTRAKAVGRNRAEPCTQIFTICLCQSEHVGDQSATPMHVQTKRQKKSDSWELTHRFVSSFLLDEKIRGGSDARKEKGGVYLPCGAPALGQPAKTFPDSASCKADLLDFRPDCYCAHPTIHRGAPCFTCHHQLQIRQVAFVTRSGGALALALALCTDSTARVRSRE